MFNISVLQQSKNHAYLVCDKGSIEQLIGLNSLFAGVGGLVCSLASQQKIPDVIYQTSK